jgi:hypothetical protein
MTFPVTADSAGTAAQTTASIAVAMPASIAAGDLLLIALDYRAGSIPSAGYSVPAGWTEEDFNLGGGGAPTVGWYSRIATGSEAGTYTFTKLSGTTSWAAVAVRIPDTVGNGFETFPGGGNASVATTTTVDPSSLAGTAVDDWLWLEAYGQSGSDWGPPTMPAGWSITDDEVTAGTSGSAGALAAIFEASTNGSSINMGAFTISDTYRAATVGLAVRFAPPPPPAVSRGHWGIHLQP